jgi:hypothetical protein
VWPGTSISFENLTTIGPAQPKTDGSDARGDAGEQKPAYATRTGLRALIQREPAAPDVDQSAIRRPSDTASGGQGMFLCSTEGSGEPVQSNVGQGA